MEERKNVGHGTPNLELASALYPNVAKECVRDDACHPMRHLRQKSRPVKALLKTLDEVEAPPVARRTSGLLRRVRPSRLKTPRAEARPAEGLPQLTHRFFCASNRHRLVD